MPDLTTLITPPSLSSLTTVLIMDDSEHDCLTYRRYLQSNLGLNTEQILEAETLEAGLSCWRSRRPDLALIDLNLPDGSGLEFLEFLKQQKQGGKLPVIVMTGQGDERTAVQSMKLGASDYLIKEDITASALCRSVSNTLQQLTLTRQLEQLRLQEALVAQISLYIHQFFKLEEIYQAIVQEVRGLLEADRVAVYKFNPDMSGVIVAESVQAPWETCLNAQIIDTCFQENGGGSYQLGHIFAAEDIYEANLTPCHLQLLERFQVRANLVVPILLPKHLTQTQSLWGLLIVHQCSGPRYWNDSERYLMQRLSVQLAIALQQAELYENVQTLNVSLEEKVSERTIELQTLLDQYQEAETTLKFQACILEEIHDAVIATDVEGRIQSWNRGAENLFGYQAEEMVGQNISLIYEDSTILYEKVIVPLLEKGEHQTEVTVMAKSGKRLDVSLRLSVIVDEQGQIVRLLGCSNDISDTKQAEQALKELNQELEARVERRTAALQQSERRLRETQQFARLGSWELDALSGKVTWSPELYEIFKLNPDDKELTYHDLSQYFSPSDRALRNELFQRAIEQGEGFEVDFQIIRADGSSGYLLSKGKPSINEAGQVTRVFGFAMDITDRKKAEENLRISEQRFATLAAAAPVAIFRIDHQNNCIYVNDYWSQITGRPSQEAFGLGWVECLHPDDREQILTLWNEQFAQKDYYRTEARTLKPDGTISWFYAQALPERDANNRMIGYIGTLTDITERKHYEAELQETNNRLARATRLKDEFLANMSHELRTPLNAILGMSEGLQNEVFGSMNTRQWEAVNLIEHSGRHLLELINDILDLAKIEAGKLELQYEFVSIHQLCESSTLFVKHLAFSKQIQLRTQIAEPIKRAWVDERRMRQVLINLLSNAVKFTPVAGQVTLNVRLEQTEILFSVIDTGIGINPQDLEKLFQPFIQIDSRLNRQYSGTGLGLTLVQRITAQHGGSVSVESQVGQGSCFTVRLPYLAPEASEVVASPTPLPVTTVLSPPTDWKASPLILLVDDNEGNMKSMEDYLSQKGYRLLLANNGKTAVELAIQHQPDLIFMDIHMPEMDGLEATEQIRSHTTLAETPIIILTALSFTDYRDRYLVTGANEYLSKPVRFKQLIETIHKFCGREEVPR